MSNEVKTLDELELFVAGLEEKIYKAISSVFDELPIEVPRQVELRGIWVSFVGVDEIGAKYKQYIPQRPTVELSVDLSTKRR